MEEAVDAEEAAGGEPLDAEEAALEEEVEAAEGKEDCFPLSTRSSLSDALKGLVISSPSSESSSTSGLQAIYN